MDGYWAGLLFVEIKAIDIVKGRDGVDDHRHHHSVRGGVLAQFRVCGLVCGNLSKIVKIMLKCIKCAKRKRL